MIEVIVAALYCLVAAYACFRVGMNIRVRDSKTAKQKFFRILLVLLMLFGLLVSVALFSEVVVFIISPNTGFDIL